MKRADRRRRTIKTHAQLLAAGSALGATLLAGGCTALDGTTPNANGQAQREQTARELRDLQRDLAERRGRAIDLASDGDVELSRGDFEDAIRRYERSVQQFPDFHAAWNNLGVALMELDRYAEAEEAFIRASAISASDPRPRYNRGLLYLNRGYPGDARAFFETALDLEPAHLGAMWGVIKCDVLIGSEDERTLELIGMALFRVQEEGERRWLQLQRERIENLLDEQRG
jgi:tetratricopeptide (TPR) repeat protein